MPISPELAKRFASRFLSPADLAWAEGVPLSDAGHGYDSFGMHPAFIATGLATFKGLHSRYFRVKSYGTENIPKTGRGILTGNHSGTIPIDGMMLWLDVLINARRVPRPIADHFVPTLPYLGVLFARAGMVGGSRGNVRALLNAGELLMIFPEGVPGIGKPYRDRYQLQDWRVGHAELAIRHQAPVIPVAFIGAEEQMPQIARLDGLGKMLGLPYLPIPASPIPLPVRYHIHYGQPIDLAADYRPEQADDPDVVREAASRVKEAVQGLIIHGLSKRKGVFR
jgi:1-acyl-sn-glycerol-3-phosphate acyltransferase